MGAFIFVLIIVGAVVTVAASKSGGNNADAIWRAAAQRLGLRFERTDTINGPTISGTRRGLSIRIDTHSKSGDDNRIYTRYHVNFKKSLGLGLRLSEQSPIAYVSRKLGGQDIVTGDRDFDDAAIVKGRDPEQVRDFLNPTRRLGVVRFFTLYAGATIHDSGIECEERDVARSPDRIVQTVQRMTTLAERLTTEGDGDPDYLAVMTHPDETDTNHRFIGLPYNPKPGPVSVEDFLEESPRSFFEAPEAIEEMVLSESEPPELDEDVPEKSEAAAQSDSGKVGPSISTVVEALFAESPSTSQTTEIFDSHYKNRCVAWSGTITNVRSYRFDLVFGDVPGTRVELEVIGTGQLPAAGRAVKAVVQFPVETEDKLRALVDRHIAFRGVLINCDAFMRMLFLANGQLSEEDT